MKIFFFFFLFLYADCFAQKEAPPGTFFLRDGLYMDKNPVANINYVEFLVSIQNFWSPEISDSIQKLPLYGLDRREVYRQKDNSWYFKNSAFIESMRRPLLFYEGLDTTPGPKKYQVPEKIRYLPVLGITYEQAAMFCKWRTDIVKLNNSVRTETERSKYYSHINYRLPTEEEWKYAFNRKAVIKKSLPFFKEPSKKKTFTVYDSIVSEFLNTRKTVIGYKINTVKVESLDDPLRSSSGIGFRCVCEVK
ncbi:MAG: hypothetical protein JWN76_308 [Chitinophagaceae bacterium]|nr:hypothetical protein [Chitinophagaceae bacterium]